MSNISFQLSGEYLFVFPLLLFLIILAAWRLRWRDYRLPRKCLAEKKRLDVLANKDVGQLPRISVVIPCHNQALDLTALLPVLLQQDYPDFEIIVCDEVSSDDTAEVLRSFTEKNSQIRFRHVPPTSRGIHHRQLSITMGIRAARGEWVVLTTADALPADNQWLRTFASHFSPDKALIVGKTDFTGTKDEAFRLAAFRSLRYFHMNLRSIRAGRPLTADLSNMALRREAFLSAGGFADSLSVATGEGEMIVKALCQTYGYQRGTACEWASACLEPAGRMLRKLPNATARRIEQTCFRHTVIYAPRRLRLYLFREGCATFSEFLFRLIALVYLLLRLHLSGLLSLYFPALSAITTRPAETLMYISDATVALLTIAFLLLPSCLLRSGNRALGLPSCFWRLHRYAMTLPFLHILDKIRHWRVRRDFCTK